MNCNGGSMCGRITSLCSLLVILLVGTINATETEKFIYLQFKVTSDQITLHSSDVVKGHFNRRFSNTLGDIRWEITGSRNSDNQYDYFNNPLHIHSEYLIPEKTGNKIHHGHIDLTEAYVVVRIPYSQTYQTISFYTVSHDGTRNRLISNVDISEVHHE